MITTRQRADPQPVRSLMGARALAVTAALAVLALLSTGCTGGESPQPRPEPPTDPDAGVKVPSTSADGIVLYDRLDLRMVAYDRSTGQETSRTDDSSDFYTYEFSPTSDLFTAGSSLEGGFSLLRRTESGAMDTLAEAPAGTDWFPLSDGADGTFLQTRPTAQEDDRSTLAEWRDGQIVPLVTPEQAPSLGWVLAGAHASRQLWVVTYDEDTDVHTLKSVRTDAEDVAASLTSHDVRLVDHPLMSDGTRIWGHRSTKGFTLVADRGRAVSDREKGPLLPCAGSCFALPDSDFMVDHAWPDQDQSLESPRLTLRSVLTAQELGHFDEVYDFTVRGDVLTTFGPEGAAEHSLTKTAKG